MPSTLNSASVFAPPPPPPVSPQPAVIIGVGELGATIIEMLRARQGLHARFKVAFGDWFDRFVCYVQLSANAPVEGSAVDIRNLFIHERQVSEAVQRLRKAFRDSRQHANQPWTDFVIPRVIVVGATWEPGGCALLWPAAALARLVIGDVIPYELLGLFVSTGYRADPSLQMEEDAYTFITLREGDELITCKVSPAWYQRLAQMMGKGEINSIDHKLYDHIFLIDSLKQNNATTRATDSTAELHTFISAVLEALLFTPTYALLDQTLLDDYLADEQQVYVGLGASSLTVPLREIEQVLREQTIARLIRNRLLVPLQPEQRQDLQKSLADRTYEARAIRELRDNTMSGGSDGRLNPLQQFITSAQNPGEHVDGESENYRLRYHLQIPVKSPSGLRIGQRVRSLFSRDALTEIGPITEIVPNLTGLRVSGPDPFSSNLSLRYLDVMNRLDSERETIVKLLGKFDDTLNEDEASRSAIAVYNQVYQEGLGKLLRGGETGLIQAIEVLERGRDRWQAATEQMTKLTDQADDDPEIIRLRDAVEGGERRSYFEENWLKVPLRWKSRFSSLFLRGLALVSVLYQFYWASIDQGEYPVPLQALGRFSFPAIMVQSWWEWWLLSFLFGLMVIVMAFLYGVPTLTLKIRLRFHRLSMTRLARVELERRFVRFAANEAKTMRDAIAALWEHLSTLRDDLAAIADRYAQNLGDDPPVRNYLEFKVVKPSDIVSQEQLIQLSREAVARQQGHVLTSWLVPTPISPVDLVSTGQVINALTTHVQPVTMSLTMKPVSDYLHEDDHARWFQYLWHGAVPWIKPRNGSTSDESPPTCNILLLNGGSNSPFAWMATHESGLCNVVPWPDPYRILLLRLLGGISADRLARSIEWRQAFQHLPEERRQGMALVPGLSENYPSTLVGETTETEMFISAEQESLTDIIFGLEDAALALVSDRQVADKFDEAGVDLALEPVRAYNQAHPTLHKQRLVDALKPLDESWEKWVPEVQTGMLAAWQRLDEFLVANDIEPVRPPTGEAYDPRHHGTALYTEVSNLPEGVITGLLYRGYRDVAANTWLRVPGVVVSSDGPDASRPSGQVRTTNDET